MGGARAWEPAANELVFTQVADEIAVLGQTLRNKLDALPLDRQVPNARNKDMPALVKEAEESAKHMWLARREQINNAVECLVEDFIAQVASVQLWRRHVNVTRKY